MNVVPIQILVPLQGDDVAHVIQVLATRPAKLGDDDILRRQNGGGLAFVCGRTTATEAFLIVRVIAQVKQLDLETGFLMHKRAPISSSVRLEGQLIIQGKVGTQSIQEEFQKRAGCHRQNKISILGRTRVSVVISGEGTDEHMSDAGLVQRSEHTGHDGVGRNHAGCSSSFFFTASRRLKAANNSTSVAPGICSRNAVRVIEQA